MRPLYIWPECAWCLSLGWIRARKGFRSYNRRLVERVRFTCMIGFSHKVCNIFYQTSANTENCGKQVYVQRKGKPEKPLFVPVVAGDSTMYTPASMQFIDTHQSFPLGCVFYTESVEEGCFHIALTNKVTQDVSTSAYLQRLIEDVFEDLLWFRANTWRYCQRICWWSDLEFVSFIYKVWTWMVLILMLYCTFQYPVIMKMETNPRMVPFDLQYHLIISSWSTARAFPFNTFTHQVSSCL